MNPKGEGGSQPTAPTAVADRPLNPASGPSVGAPSTNPLSNLEEVVAAAQQAAAAAAVQNPPPAPAEQFTAQFGSAGTTPPAVETPADASVAPLNPNIKTVDDLLAKGPQTVEAVAPAEKTPADKLKEQISASIDAFLADVTQK